jgi:hypothetical protein
VAHLLGDRVKETSTTTGTGTLALGGAVTNFQAFSAILANNDTTLYAIVHQSANEWETGLGTWTTGNNLARTTVFDSSNAGAAVNLSAGTKHVFIIQTTSGPFGPLAAGSATIPPLLLQAGTLMTTPSAGAIELDADAFYATSDVGNRGVIRVAHIIRAASAQTLTSTGSAQSLFDSPANGTITLETGVYFYQLMALITGMSATSGNGELTFAGTGTFGGWLRRAAGLDNTTPGTIADDDAAWVTTATGHAASMFAAGTGTAMRMYESGSFECTGAGTLIPSITLVTAAAATVAEGSYFICERWGAAAMASVGQWT